MSTHKPELTIRVARVEDAPTLTQAERTITATPGLLVPQPAEITVERLADKISALGAADNGRFVVAVANGQIVGHGMLDPLPLAAVRHVVHLTLVTHPGWQGRGVGRAVLENLIEWAQSAPALEKIELNVRSSNAQAIALYGKLGFNEVGRWRRRVKVGPNQFLDDIAMELLVK